jgi:hypothetical protein
VCLHTVSYAQLLDNSRGLAFTDLPFFNTPFVKASHLKQIKGTYIFKKQGDILRESQFVYVFNFDTLGRLVQQYQTAKGDVVTDTTVSLFDYTFDGKLVRKRVSQTRGFLSTYYSYNNNGQVTQEEVYRDIDTTHSLLSPKAERSILWNSETMSYSKDINSVRKKVYNSYGIQYLESTSYFDSLGLLKNVEELYMITRDRIVTNYNYNQKGWVERISTRKNNDTIPLSENIFTYDDFGNLKSKFEYKKGVFTTEYQVIYSGLTGMLYSVIIREVASNFISIIKFSEPTFYDSPLSIAKDLDIVK